MSLRPYRFEGVDLDALEAQGTHPAVGEGKDGASGALRGGQAIGAPVGDFDPEVGLRAKRLANLRTHRSAVVEVAQDLKSPAISSTARTKTTQRLSRLRDEVESRLRSPEHATA